MDIRASSRDPRAERDETSRDGTSSFLTERLVKIAVC
jgi:hypothetical protein